MNSKTTGCALVLAAVLIAAGLRLPSLTLRPMHGDEAVHAYKFGELLEDGFYQYDPHEYHGPTLNYFTLIPAWLRGEYKIADVDEITLRIVPVFFSLVLILLTLLLADGLSWPVVGVLALLTAVSPAMVFYSRYYIQEMLLVCFTFGVMVCTWRYVRTRKPGWVVFAGMCLGLMHATKETCVIAYGSMSAALVLTVFMSKKDRAGGKDNSVLKPAPIIVGGLSAVLVSVIFFSSFFSHPAGILDSVRTFSTYFDRAGNNLLHIHPWYYYFKILLWNPTDRGLVWSEVFVLPLALAGFLVAMLKKGLKDVDYGLLRFIAFYTAIMAMIYAVIPYKTPWCMLGFLHGVLILAACGFMFVFNTFAGLPGRILWSIVLFIGLAVLAGQAWLGNIVFYDSTHNPYVYAHPVREVYKMEKAVAAIARVHPEGHAMPVQVICKEDDYWPLPWYLRSFTGVRWRNKVEDDVVDAAVIIVTPDMEADLVKTLYEVPPPGSKNLYVPLFDEYLELRPTIELRGYVRQKLWERMMSKKSGEAD
ncbi:MAG: TIGR03663 family protein [Sedimentisphaerales bacterium]|nr:TIGR03663 family protein [Sedimentisphaerales bacterium]